VAALVIMIVALGWSVAGGGSDEPAPGAGGGSLVQQGLEAYQRGDLAGATQAWRDAVAAQPDDALARFNLGIALNDQGDTAGAERNYRAAVKLDPALVSARYNLAVLLEGSGRKAAAVAQYRAVLREEPANASALWNLGLILYSQDRESEARPLLQKAIQLDSSLRARTPQGVEIN
jgi:Flp pilus assembly protein TadD